MGTYNNFSSSQDILNAINCSRRLYGMVELDMRWFHKAYKSVCSDIRPVSRKPYRLWLAEDAAEIEELLWDWNYVPRRKRSCSTVMSAKKQHEPSAESLSKAEKTVISLAAEVSGLSLEEYIWSKGIKKAKAEAVKVFDILKNL